MPKVPSNHLKPWMPADRRQLAALAAGNTPTRLIAYKLKRTESAVYSEAGRLGISLKPVNQSLYNRRSTPGRRAQRRAR